MIEIFGQESDEELIVLNDPDINKKVFFEKLYKNAENTGILKHEKDKEDLTTIINEGKEIEVSHDETRKIVDFETRKKLVDKYNTDFVMLQGLEEMKYKIRETAESKPDPFIDIFEKLNDDDRIMIEQITLQKFLKNGAICNKEFQKMAEDAFTTHNDLMIYIPDDEMKSYNLLFNDNKT